MRRSEEEGVRRLLRMGWRHLRSGQARDAADAFGRVLLRRPDQREARHGHASARAAVAEMERVRALEAPRSSPAAHVHRATLATHGTPSVRQVRAERPAAEREARANQRGRRSGPRAAVWTRRIFLAGGGLALALTLAVVSARWHNLVAALLRPPATTTTLPASFAALPTRSAGQSALSEARRRLLDGDRQAARELLGTIQPEDPAYPFAQSLQLELPHAGERR